MKKSASTAPLFALALTLLSGSAHAASITCSLNAGQPDNSPQTIVINELSVGGSIKFTSEDADGGPTAQCVANYVAKPKATKWAEYDVTAQSTCQEVSLKLIIADKDAPKALEATYSDAGSRAYYTCK